jgi:hypothetical protein
LKSPGDSKPVPMKSEDANYYQLNATPVDLAAEITG